MAAVIQHPEAHATAVAIVSRVAATAHRVHQGATPRVVALMLARVAVDRTAAAEATQAAGANSSRMYCPRPWILGVVLYMLCKYEGKSYALFDSRTRMVHVVAGIRRVPPVRHFIRGEYCACGTKAVLTQAGLLIEGLRRWIEQFRPKLLKQSDRKQNQNQQHRKKCNSQLGAARRYCACHIAAKRHNRRPHVVHRDHPAA